LTTFNELNLSNPIIRALSNMGFEEATPIQEQTIPLAMQGKDLIGQAQTGTGKTAAFGIPLVEKATNNQTQPQALVLTPTRELAVQVAEELNKIGQYNGVRTIPIYGGQDIERQIRALKKKPQMIVATPGRFMDHMRRKTIRLNEIKMVILDEADEMLNMGFIEDIETILKEIPEGRQTLLFSATMPKQIQNLANNFMVNPELVSIKSKELTVPNIEQQYVEVNEKQKFDSLCRLLDVHSPELAIIFGRTKRRVDELVEALNKRGYGAEGIHGDLNQRKRDSVLKKFKEGEIDILVATDVAARGLDISGVTHVYNFDIPQDPEGYVHRVGRTGRAGKTGIAITFVNPREIPFLRTIEKVTKRKIIRKSIPTMSEAIEGQIRLTIEKLLEVIEEGKFYTYQEMAEKLLDDHDSVVLVSAALKMMTKEPDATPIKLTEEEPLRAKRERRERSGGSNYGQSRNKDKNKSGSSYSKGRSAGSNNKKGGNQDRGKSYNKSSRVSSKG